MNLSLSGQGVVVVGGAQGIGLAIARAFVAEGCVVGVFDCHQESLVSLSGEEMRATFHGDISDEKSLEKSVEYFAENLGSITHVVNAVGVGSGHYGFPFWRVPTKSWARVLEINLIGSAKVAHAFSPYLVEQKRGSFLFLTSVAGQIGSQTDPPYSAAKAGVINFMQCLAKDLAPFRVRANCLSPGMVQTTLNESVWAAGQAELPKTERQTYEAWAKEKISKVSPLGKWQTPEEFGAMAAFLASEHARNITGQTINIDGGQVMHS